MHFRCQLARAQNLDARQLLPLDELERGAAAGRDVLHLRGDVLARGVHRRRAVAAADDGEGARRGHGARDAERPGGEGRLLEEAHRAVPEDRLRLAEALREKLRRSSARCRAPSCPAGTCIDVDRLGLALRPRRCSRRRRRRPAGAPRPPWPAPSRGSSARAASLSSSTSDACMFLPLRGEERVGHRPADDERVHLLEERLDDRDLVARPSPRRGWRRTASRARSRSCPSAAISFSRRKPQPRVADRASPAPCTLACARCTAPNASST